MFCHKLNWCEFASSVSKLSDTVIIAVLENFNDKPIWNDQTDINLNHTRLNTGQINAPQENKMSKRSLSYSYFYFLFSCEWRSINYVVVN